MEEKQQVYEALFQAALDEPMDYFPHDTNTFDDDSLWGFFEEKGYRGLGMFWRLVELLSQKKGHAYKKTDRRLAQALYLSAEECEELLESLVRHGLLDRGLYSDGFVSSCRVTRNAEGYAAKVAGARLGAEMTNRKKAGR